MPWKTAPMWRTIVLALLLSSGAASAFAIDGRDTVTDVRQAEPVQLGTLTVSPPHIGDQATYRWVGVDVAREDTFRFLEPLEAPDLDGTPRLFDRLDYDVWGGTDGRPGAWSGAETRIEFADARQGRVAGRLTEGTSNGGHDGCRAQCPEGETDVRRVVDHYPAGYVGRTPCFVFSPLQGRTIDLANDTVALTQSCGWLRDEVASVRARVRLPDNDTGLVVFPGQGRIHEVWYKDGLPYPVRVLFANETGPSGVEMQLVALARGDRPLATSEGTVPTLARSALNDLGPDAGGFEGPFTLAEAYHIGVDHEDGEPARAVAQRAGAYLAAAWVANHVVGDQRTIQTWHMLVTDGDDAVWLNVTRDAGEHDVGIPVPGTHRVEDTVATGPGRADNRPAMADRFDAPSASTLAAAWRRSGGAGEFDSWGFSWRMDEGPELTTWAGHDVHFSENEGPMFSSPVTQVGGGGPLGQVEDHVMVTLGVESVEAVAFERNVKARYVEPTAAHDGSTVVHAEPTTMEPAAVTFTVWQAPTAAAVTGAGLLVLLIAAVHHFFPGVMGLFSRVRHDDVLDHPLRRRMMATIEAEPGIHFQAIVSAIDAPKSTVRHHVRKLEQVGCIKVRTAGGYTCHFPVTVDGATIRQAPVVRAEGARRILASVRSGPGQSLSDLAKEVGLRVSTVRYHVQRLEGAGILTVERGPRGAYRIQAA